MFLKHTGWERVTRQNSDASCVHRLTKRSQRRRGTSATAVRIVGRSAIAGQFPCVSNTLDDGSTGSLRWAVAQANESSGADEITFDPSLFSSQRTIALEPAGGNIAFTDTSKTTLRGPGADLLQVHGK